MTAQVSRVAYTYTPPREGSLANATCVRAKAGVAIKVAAQMFASTKDLPTLGTEQGGRGGGGGC